MKRSAVVCTVN